MLIEELPADIIPESVTETAGPLARKSLLISASLALLGSIASVPEIMQGHIHSAEAWLIESGVVFESAIISILIFSRRIRMELIALTCTAYFSVYLSLGCLLTLFDGQDPLHFIVFFLWFSPLMIFNRLVNKAQAGTKISGLLTVVPLFIVVASWIELKHTLPQSTLYLLTNLALSHLMVGVMLEPLTRYRSAYVLEKERAESLRKEAELVERIAFYDPLTGLPNRASLQRQMNAVLSTSSTACGLLLVDLDDFRTLNDTLGHDVGDLFLQEVARRLVDVTGSKRTLARLGGDEFAIFLQHIVTKDQGLIAETRTICEHIHLAFRQPFQVGEFDWTTSTSIGISVTSGAAESTDDLLKQADLALHRAKSLGRNRACHFDPEMKVRVGHRAQLAGDLHGALLKRHFTLVYQPQIDSAGRLLGAEALLRWQHPERGIIPPSDFIPLAEESGLIVSIGEWVLETACAQLRSWSEDRDLRELTMSVNVSVKQFTDYRFVSTVKRVLAQTQVNPGMLKLELTESTVMEDVDENISRMEELIRTGIRFSLDDFGTGHSSLAYLKRLPFQQVKLDRSFVSGVLDDRMDASITRTVIMLATNLNLSIIAEGVETLDQLEFLARQGCHEYQGFLFSRPLSVGQFREFAVRKPHLELLDRPLPSKYEALV